MMSLKSLPRPSLGRAADYRVRQAPGRVSRVGDLKIQSIAEYRGTSLTRGAADWGPETGPRLVVLSDFACSYCRKLSAELKKGGFRVEERPISIFGEASRHAAERVLCAPDPVAALHAAYEANTIAAPRKCDTSGLDANEAFAKRHGFGGTPVVIRTDGLVAEGYRTAEQLLAFVNGNKA
jgi:thiol:disulfide interchange protein DsbC